MRILMPTVILLGLFIILPLGCMRKSATSDTNRDFNEAVDLSEVPEEVREVFKKLSGWDIEETDVAECPDKYPGRVASGETNAWLSRRKEDLKELGFIAEWNCDSGIYELFEVEH